MKVAIEGNYLPEDMTEWFDPHIKPVRQGVYEVQSSLSPTETFWSNWNGEHWKTVKYYYGVAKVTSENSSEQNRTWRGLKCSR